jgi:quercetin dioxygenase-like cupin family protein
MPFLRPDEMLRAEPLPGWQGRFWRSESMSFAHYTIAAGASIHEHHHPHEEVWIVIEGLLEVTVDGVARTAGPGAVAVVPPDVRHSVRALEGGTAVVANHPVRHEIPGGRRG